MGQLVNKELLDLRVFKVNEVMLDHQDHKVSREIQEPLDNQDLRDKLVLLDQLDSKGREE